MDKGGKGRLVDFFPGNHPRLCSMFNDELSGLRLEKIDSDTKIVTVWMDVNYEEDGFRQYIGFGDMTDTENVVSIWNQNRDQNETEENYMGLMCEDDAQRIDIPKGLVVTVCSDAWLKGDCKAFPGPDTVTLGDWDLDDKVSSISVQETSYEIVKVHSKKITTTNSNDKSRSMIKGGIKSEDNRQAEYTIKQEFELEESVTDRWENSEMLDATLVQTGGVSGGIPGLVEASAEVSASTSFEKTFSFGKETTATRTVGGGHEIKVFVDPGEEKQVVGTYTPSSIEQILEVTLKQKGTENTRTEKIIRTFKTGTEFNAIIEVVRSSEEPASPSTDNENLAVFNSNSFYRLTNKWQGDGKSLDILNDGNIDQPILGNTGNFSGQSWKINKVGENTYTLTTEWQGDGRKLDCTEGNHNRPVLNEADGPSATWMITPTGDGYYRISNKWLSDSSLDIINDGENNKIQMAKTGNYFGQFWKITEIKE